MESGKDAQNRTSAPRHLFSSSENDADGFILQVHSNPVFRSSRAWQRVSWEPAVHAGVTQTKHKDYCNMRTGGGKRFDYLREIKHRFLDLKIKWEKQAGHSWTSVAVMQAGLMVENLSFLIPLLKENTLLFSRNTWTLNFKAKCLWMFVAGV